MTWTDQSLVSTSWGGTGYSSITMNSTYIMNDTITMSGETNWASTSLDTNWNSSTGVINIINHYIGSPIGLTLVFTNSQDYSVDIWGTNQELNTVWR